MKRFMNLQPLLDFFGVLADHLLRCIIPYLWQGRHREGYTHLDGKIVFAIWNEDSEILCHMYWMSSKAWT